MELVAKVPGVTAAGENEQLKLLGSPEQASATVVSKEPACGVTVTFIVPADPGLIVIAEGLAAKVMLAA
jgi:hypothetical protein